MSCLLGVLAALLAAGSVSSAQDESAPAVVARDEVDLRVVRAGPGGMARAGDWAGVLVEFKDSALESREILLRLSGIDRDGDPPAFDRVVVGDPDRPRGAWLYGVMPYAESTGRVAITAHEAVEGAADEGGTGFRAGRVLGRAWLDTGDLLEPESGLYGLIGTRDLGLRQFGVLIQSSGKSLPLGHEHTEIASGLGLEDIPDRWQGLAPFSVLVWSRGGPEADPTGLGAEQAAAIMDWVRRGGHLVVALPPVGQEWLVPARNPLSPILPLMQVERREGVDLGPYRPLLTFDRLARLPEAAVVHVMSPRPDAARDEAMPVLAGPDGGCVVMRRAVGTGMVTVVGLDLGAESLTASGTLDAEALWHRVLGRRHSLETFEEIRARDRDLSAAVQQRVVADFDADVESAIDRTGDSTTGVLLSLGVFGLYWLLAGPVGFALLTRWGRRAMAWVAFLGAGAAFTALAWAGASVLRPTRVEGTHLAFLTAVHGQPTHTVSAWSSVLIPSYGRATISIGGEGAEDDLIAPWTPPPPSGRGGGFPDNRGYALSARRPNSMTPPVRSTIKQVSLDWSGPARWGAPAPAGQPGEVAEPALRLIDPDNAVVEGELVHTLPGPLEDVLVVVVTRQVSLPTSSVTPAWLPSRVFMDKPSLESWAPGARLDLKAVTGGGTRTSMERSGLTWLRDASDDGVGRSFGGDGPLNTADAPTRFTALTFFDMIEAPDFLNFRAQLGRAAPLAARRVAHDLDLSRWLTQPCVIVVGHLVQREAGEAPVPVEVDGRAIPSRGRTIVRYVYPLEPRPPEYNDAATGLP